MENPPKHPPSLFELRKDSAFALPTPPKQPLPVLRSPYATTEGEEGRLRRPGIHGLTAVAFCDGG
ncbi:MAG: hypothetical protein HYT42_00655 [Candidatus Sungbacteria bacterium]|nr:hypothetical protein [Candidatus Sungbacteria bacterium]